MNEERLEEIEANAIELEYPQFVIAVFRATVASEGDPGVVHRLLRENLELLDLTFARTLQQWAPKNFATAEFSQKEFIADVFYNFNLIISSFRYGSRSDNIEIAIACLEINLQVFTRENSPVDWARAQNSLGIKYSDRLLGERAENLEKAIACYEAALQVRTRSTDAKDWSETQNNLGNAYLYRLLGERTENLEKAIACYAAALQVRTRSTDAEDWAETQNNLAVAYRNRLWGERAENLEKAIAYYQAALQVYTRSAYADKWAMTQNNLGNAYRNRLRGKRAENLEKAIACYEAALQIYTPSTYPRDWAMVQKNLAYAYIDLRQPAVVLQHFHACLEVLTPSSDPLSCFTVGYKFGNFAYARQDWENAIYGYDNAIGAIESRDWATSKKTKRELVADSLDLYEQMVQACIQQKDYRRALLTVERSKSRTFTELLANANLYPKNATDAQKQQIDDLRIRIAIYQQQLQFSNSQNINNPNYPDTIRKQIEVTNQEFQNLLADIGDPTFTLTQKPSTKLPNFSEILDSQTALIQWYLPNKSHLGFYAFLVIPTEDDNFKIVSHHCAFTNRKELDEVITTYRSDYGEETWYSRLEQRLIELSTALDLPNLLVYLQHCQRLIVVPYQELHEIPFHALPISLPSPFEGVTKYLQDEFHIQYAPGCQLLHILHERPELAETSTSFFAVQNPAQDLTFAQMEVEVLRSSFNPQLVLSDNEATIANFKKPETKTFLQQSRYIHFSCHGEFNQADPLNSYLCLAKPEKLTLEDIFRLDISNCRLLVLSACRTALADNYIGLTSAFLYAGVRTVIASLWEADDFFAALLMIRLYQELPCQPSVSLALQAAQNWLRAISRDDVLTWLQQDIKVDPEQFQECKARLELFEDDPPFARAEFWAAFTAAGL